MFAHLVDDEVRIGRHAGIVEDGDELVLACRRFVDEQGAQLGIAVLFEHEDRVVVRDEVLDLRMEGEGADAQIVDVEIVLGIEAGDRFLGRAPAPATPAPNGGQ